jgi:hypothetical protein
MQDLLANIHCYVIFKYIHECDIYRQKFDLLNLHLFI